MVKYERKPVQFLPRPPVLDPNAEVWLMEETGEVFVDYESYLRRRDFYKQKKFTCDVTGHSGLTFFEALESETEGSRTIDSTFPPSLREPVLRQVQFSTISRLDDLVTHTFNVFKRNFFPGESITVILPDRPKMEGVIREAAKFPEMNSATGTLVRKGFSRYFVKLLDVHREEVLVDEDHVTRDRRAFSKQMLRSFLKATLTHEPWAGAPWLVKENIARQYKIDTKIPERLLHSTILENRKANLASRNGANQGTFLNFHAIPQPHDGKGFGKMSKAKMSQYEMAIWKQSQQIQYQQAMINGDHPSFVVQPDIQQFHVRAIDDNHHPRSIAAKNEVKQVRPLPVKYPIEDLDVPPRRELMKRPQLQAFSEDQPGDELSNKPTPNVLAMNSVGPLLEVWNTLNVLCEVYLLDSFTLDDFVDAMRFTHPDIDCELFQEMHCSVLKLLVSENGQVQVSLPKLPESDDENEGSSDDTGHSTPLQEPDVETSGRVTRSSGTSSEILKATTASHQSTPESIQTNRAAELVAEYGWIDRLKAREFRDGGWQVIMVGLLQQLSLVPQQRSTCEDILAKLAPMDQKPTPETVRFQYTKLDVNLRIAALQMITLLSVQTKAVRNYLEECSESMTVYRKDKIEWQRKKKTLMDEVRDLDERRRLLLPENMPKSPEPQETAEAVTSQDPTLEVKEPSPPVTEDEEESVGRSTRRSSGRHLDLKRKRDEENAKMEKEKEDKRIKLEAANGTKQQSAAFKKLLKEIESKKDEIKECEDHIIELENDLREANCQRTKVLGRDRFWNRYIWFERNGMPFGGLESSSTHQYGYANGRLWVQGPEGMEREGFIEISEEQQKAYKARFGLSLRERKEAEEGSTRLRDAHHWGYIDDPNALDALIGWLDDRGKREKGLKKELLHWKEQIANYMKIMKGHLAEMEERKSAGGGEQATRVTTRTKTYVDPSTTKHSCLVWRNDYALEKLGHRHYEQQKPKPKNGKRAAATAGGWEQKGVARLLNGKTGKPLTRQGTRYGKL